MRKLSTILFVSVIVAICSNSALGVDAGGIETVMRKYQNKYHYVKVVQNQPGYLSWPYHHCTDAPSYPEGFYGEITEEKAEYLVNNIVWKFYDTAAIYGHFIENPEGQETTQVVSVTEPDSADSWQSKLAQVDSDLGKLIRYNENSPSDVNVIQRAGSGWDWAEFSGSVQDCNLARTENGSFGDATDMAESDWNDANSTCMATGVVVTSQQDHCYIEFCNNPVRNLTYDSYSAFVKSRNPKYQDDLTEHTGSAVCYLRTGQYNNGGTYCGNLDGTDGLAPYCPVTADETYHSWSSASVGQVWKSDYLFDLVMPTIPAPSRELGYPMMCYSENSYTKVTQKAWSVIDELVVVMPSFPSESDPVISMAAPTELIYKDKDKHTVYSAGQGCGHDSGETVKGRILINGYDPTVSMRLEVKLNSTFSDEVAKMTFYRYNWDSVVVDGDDPNWLNCITPQRDDPNDDWHVPFQISAYVGQDSVSVSIATVYTEELGDDASDPNEADRLKTYRGEGESVSFQITTNGYECCNRKETLTDFPIPQITKHENNDIEIYYPDIDQSYIWGGSHSRMMYPDSWIYGLSQNCEFLEDGLSDYAANEILLSSIGSGNGLVYTTASGWTTACTASSAAFDREIDADGNTIRSAVYDANGRLDKITQAADPTNLYRQFHYDDTADHNKVTSYTNTAGNLSRTYTLIYDPTTGRLSGTIGGTGSGCGSCCSAGGTVLYTYNDAGYVLTESDTSGTVIHEYEYDEKNRLTNKWLGAKTAVVPIQEVIYDVNAADYGGSQIQDVYDYTTGADYGLTRNILNTSGQVITEITYNAFNMDANSIPTEPNAIIASGGAVSLYEYEQTYSSSLGRYVLSAVSTKSPLFNAGLSTAYKKQTLNNSSSNYERDYLVTVDSNEVETETELNRTAYNSNDQVYQEYDRYGIENNQYTFYGYDSEGRLSYSREPSITQLNGQTTRRYTDYSYYPDGRTEKQTVKNDGDDNTEVITIYLYNSINQQVGTQAVDHANFELYESEDPYTVLQETYSLSNGFGDVIYTIDRTGVARGKKYDDGGKVVSEFVFAEPNDTALFNNAAYNDMSSVYDTLNVISQTHFDYDANGVLESIQKAIDDEVFVFDSPDSWSITAYGYDDYGRKTAETKDFGGDNLTTAFEYDHQGRIVKTTYPNSHWQKQTYNGRGLIVKTVNGYGAETTDPNDFLIVRWEYDANANRIKQIERDGTEYIWVYDDMDRVIREPIIPPRSDYTREIMSIVPSEQLKPKRSFWKGGEFEPLGQYADGYGLSVYAGGDPVNNRDDWGLAKCNAFHYRMAGGYGHEGLLINGNDYDFGPVFVNGTWPQNLWGTTWGISPWHYNDDDLSDDNFEWKKELKVKKTGSMTVGNKVIKCKCATCSDISRCANEQSADWNGSRYIIVGHSCRTFTRSTKKNCCLTN